MQNVEKNVTVVTLRELCAILANTVMVHGMGKIAFITQLTVPKYLKNVRVPKGAPKVPFTGHIEKKSSYSIILNNEYVTAVVNQLAREGKEKTDYKAGQNTMPIDKSESKNNFFGYYVNKAGQKLPVIEMKPNKGSAVKPTSQYYLNGMPVEKSALPDVLPKEYPAENQGTEKEILWRKVYLSNVLELSIDGSNYKIVK